jgi:hypothetical protein
MNYRGDETIYCITKPCTPARVILSYYYTTTISMYRNLSWSHAAFGPIGLRNVGGVDWARCMGPYELRQRGGGTSNHVVGWIGFKLPWTMNIASRPIQIPFIRDDDMIVSERTLRDASRSCREMKGQQKPVTRRVRRILREVARDVIHVFVTTTD